jgi:hypothetical protein
MGVLAIVVVFNLVESGSTRPRELIELLVQLLLLVLIQRTPSGVRRRSVGSVAGHALAFVEASVASIHHTGEYSVV